MTSAIRLPGEPWDEYEAMESLYSTPARRFLSSETVPGEVVQRLIDVAAQSPQAGSARPWAWVAVTDRHLRTTMAGWYRRSTASGDGSVAHHRDLAAAGQLATHLEEAPVWIVPVLLGADGPPGSRSLIGFYSAITSLTVAAQGYGLGPSATVLAVRHENRMRGLLNLPDNALVMAVIPLGYPARGDWLVPARPADGAALHWNSFGTGRSHR
ncbi:nitroreductase family protein [Actinoplanes sp. NPDC048796]|uniref:nitroreductase family protein n=1 Tax=unclassified Actinoplanes TaxID=2626549 RepID=UPI0033F09151